MKKLLITIIASSLFLMMLAQSEYSEGNFPTVVVDETFYKEIIPTGSDRNKAVIKKNMDFYNEMVEAYNQKDYKTALYNCRKAFYGSIGEKIQFTTYFKKYPAAEELRQNTKVILFVSLINKNKLSSKDKIEIQEVYDYIYEKCHPKYHDFIEERAQLFNETAQEKIVLRD